jgi:multidrug transporter EmrE-like cation transporter
MSNLSSLLWLGASAVLMGVSNLCLKSSVAGAGSSKTFVFGVIRQPAFVCGFLLFAFASLIYIRALKSISLSTAYPVFASIAFAVVAVGAVMLFDERFNASKILGSAFLVAGIAFIARS